MRLFLIRHGQTAWNAEERAQGHTDIPLDEIGMVQAHSLARHFEGLELDLVLSSDLRRSAETARPLAEAVGAKLEETPSLRERSFGDWEGLLYTEFADMAKTHNMTQGSPIAAYAIRPPGGESLEDAWNRLIPVSARLKETPQRTAVVGHGGVCSILLAQLLNGTLDTTRAFRFSNCGVTELTRRADGSFQLLRFNDCDHLRAPTPQAYAATR